MAGIEGHIKSSSTSSSKYLPEPFSRHLPGCGCLRCAEWRVTFRARGGSPKPALDWRGVPLKGVER